MRPTPPCRHALRIKASRCPADRGEAIKVPCLAFHLDGDLSAPIRRRFCPHRLVVDPSAAILTRADLNFRFGKKVVEIDMEASAWVLLRH